eukprot:XP_766104.1 hypothetical protein [Theileria parva strain Muguga]
MSETDERFSEVSQILLQFLRHQVKVPASSVSIYFSSSSSASSLSLFSSDFPKTSGAGTSGESCPMESSIRRDLLCNQLHLPFSLAISRDELICILYIKLTGNFKLVLKSFSFPQSE